MASFGFDGSGTGGGPGSGLPAGTAVGQYLRWNGTLWVPVVPFSRDAFVYSCSTLINTAGSTFLPCRDGNGNSISTDTGGGFIARTGDVIAGGIVSHAATSGADPLVYNVHVNGAPTAFSVALSSGALGPVISNTSIVLAQGDLVTVGVSGLTANRVISPLFQLSLLRPLQ